MKWLGRKPRIGIVDQHELGCLLDLRAFPDVRVLHADVVLQDDRGSRQTLTVHIPQGVQECSRVRIRGKGAQPVEPKKEYVFGLPLSNEKDVLELAFKLEVGAARVYLYVVDRFQDRALSGSAARILSDEVLHATVLRSVLGREVVPTFKLIEN